MISDHPRSAILMAITRRKAVNVCGLAIAPGGMALLGMLLVGIMASTGCGRGYKETVIPAKEFTPLERARQMLERYAEGAPVGSEFMGFELLKEELAKTSPDRSDAVGEALAAIEKVMRRPAEVKAIAQRTLAELDKPAAPRE